MTLLLQAFGALRSTQCARASVFVYLAVLCGNSSVTNPAEWNGNERCRSWWSHLRSPCALEFNQFAQETDAL